MATMLQTKLPPIIAVPTYPASGLPMRLPTNISTTNDASGSSVARMRRKAGAGMDRESVVVGSQ